MSLKALAFLQRVLPEQGSYVAWTKLNQKRSYNTVLTSIEALVSHIFGEDASGKSVYHACATFREAQGVWNDKKNKLEVRTQANALAARAFWFDIDGGADAVAHGTGYADATAAWHAVVAFCSAAHLPPPLFVGSGSGLHAYFPLSKDVPTDEWAPYAVGLKQAAHVHGLRFDPTRTADIASVLRTPGTHNRKGSVALEVQCGELEGPYPLAEFAHVLAYAQPASAPTKPAAKPTPLTAAITAQTYDTCYSETVADNCAQVNLLRTTMGNLPEPLWYASLGVLSRCVDGERFAHEWSAGYDGYTAEETDSKLKRTLTLTGATTCAKFESLDPQACASCPHRGTITSPIALGRRSSKASPTSPGAPKQASLSAPAAAATPGSLYSEPLPPLRLPWKWSRKRQLVMEVSREDRDVEMLISEYPIFLDGVQVSEASSGKFSYHFKQYLPQRGWIDILLQAKQLMGVGGLAEMFDRGAVIHDHKAFTAYVRTAVDAYHAEKKLRTRYDQFGWKDTNTSFLYGSKLYSEVGVHETVGSEEVKTRSQWLVPTRGGSLERWSDAANALFQEGCEVQSFALLCSFAAPLMRFHATEEGGAIIALNSRESGSGKTTTLAAVASVWGQSKGLALTNIDTRVSKALTLGVLGNLPIIYDELTNRDPEIIREFVLMFTNGRDRMRGTAEGEIRHTQASWQTLLVSTSNASLVDVLQHASGVDALAFRALELPLHLPEHVAHRKGDALRKELEANAGYAGDAYLRYLIQADVLDWTRAALRKWTEEIWQQTKLRAEHRFWVRTLGSVAVAATLVNQLGILSFQPSRIMEWALKYVEDNKDDAPVSGHGSEVSISSLSEFLSEHISDTLIVARAYRPGDKYTQPLMKPARRLHVRYEVENGRILISEKPLRAWLLRQEIGYRQFVHELNDAHVVLTPRRMATLSAGTDYPGGQQPCVEVNALHPALSGVVTDIVNLQQRRMANGSPLTPLAELARKV